MCERRRARDSPTLQGAALTSAGGQGPEGQREGGHGAHRVTASRSALTPKTGCAPQKTQTPIPIAAPRERQVRRRAPVEPILGGGGGEGGRCSAAAPHPPLAGPPPAASIGVQW